MERYKVDGLDLTHFYTPETLLGTVFRDIENDLSVEKKVVCQYIINGYSVSEDEEEHFATLTLKEVTTFEYLAEDRRRLVKSVLQVWQEAIPEMLSQLNQLNNLEKRLGFLDQVKTLVHSMETIEANLGDSWLAATTWVQDVLQLKKVFLLLEIQLNTQSWVKFEPVFKKKFSESLRLCLKSFGELDTLVGYAEDSTNDSTNDPVDRSAKGH